MNETTWQRVKEIFHEAVELSREQRDAFVAKACSDNPALLAEVGDLLASHDADEGLMKSPTFQGGEAGGAEASGESVSPGGALLEGPGTIVGRYKLLQEIGSGGFGVVYLAEQVEPVKRRVALKIIKLGMDTKQVIARFEAERQALAMMDHPNIARVLDAGATETGRPFFAMELVRGIPITEYCDKEKLDTRQRLDLFIKVCHAIQHAHQKGIIHRDIKPTNVLVTMHDDVPVPRVIDFGIAKATKAELTERTLFTEHGLMIGTPAYMSPEQAQMSDLDIDTRSDIYSLGVLLYELLTGTTPFSSKELREAGFGEIQRIIREEEPHKPSTRVSSLLARGGGFKGPRGQGAKGAGGEGTAGTRDQAINGEVGSALPASLDPSLPQSLNPSVPHSLNPSVPQSLATDIARQRGTDPASLTRLLRGDLDWIVMKALEKNRTRRYETAAGLAMDIRRHLDHEPVLAGPPSASYRLRKLARKHRTLVGGVAALFIVLLCSVVVIGAMYRRAENARQLAQENETLAEDRETEATEARDQLQVVVDFQSSMLSDIDAEQMGRSIIDDLRHGIREVLESSDTSPNDVETTLAIFDNSITGVNATNLALEMIDEHILVRAVEAIEQEFVGRPHLRAALQQTVADSYRELGLYDRAKPLQEDALEALREELGDGQKETLSSMHNMGALLLAMGQLTEAEAYMHDCLVARRRLLGNDHEETLQSVSGLAAVLRAQGRLADAEPYYHDSLESSRRVLGDDHPDALAALNNLGSLLYEQGRLSEAEECYQRALAGRRRVLGDDHPDTLTSLDNMGTVLTTMGRYTEAEPFRNEALSGRRRVLGDDHPTTLVSINNMGYLLQGQGKFEEAEPYFHDAMQGCRRILGPDHPNTLTAIGNFGSLLRSMGRLADAEPYYREALESSRRVLGNDHPATLESINSMGFLARTMDRLDDAETYFREAVEGSLRVLGGDHPFTLTALGNLATVLHMKGELSEAESYFRQSLSGTRRVLGEDHPDTLLALNAMGRSMRAQGKLAAAESFGREALEGQRRILGDDHPSTLISMHNLGSILRDLERIDEAEQLGAEAVRGAREKMPPQHSFLLAALTDHARTLVVQRRYEEAEADLGEAYGGFIKTRGSEYRRTQDTVKALVNLYTAWGKPDRAAEWQAKLPPADEAEAHGVESEEAESRD